jgi:CubicO group peptidase (beta-lactamase class C family)
MEDEAHVADMATGYTMEKKGNYVPVGSFRGWAGGAGTIVSTATDLAKWDAALFSGKIVSNTDLKLMTAPGPLPALRTDRYGFGWVLDTFDGQPRIWHNGGTLGFNSSNQIYPKSAQTVIVLTNMAGGADSLANGIFDSLHPDLAAAKSKTVSGEDAAITARAKTVWAQFPSGNLERSQFTGEMNKALTPDLIAGAKAQFGSLGDATSWVYRGKNVVNGMATYTYRVSFSSGTSLNVYMSIDKNDKIAGYLASPN